MHWPRLKCGHLQTVHFLWFVCRDVVTSVKPLLWSKLDSSFEWKIFFPMLEIEPWVEPLKRAFDHSSIQLPKTIFLKMGQPRPLFRLFSVLSNNQYNFYNNQCEKMFIQYTAPGFEPTTSQTWIVTHNHLSRAPAHPKTIFVGALIEWLLLETRNVEIVCSNLNQMNYFSQYGVKLFCCLKRLRSRMSHLRKNAF